MPQFFLDETMKPGAEIAIRGGQARHIAQVLRLKAGDWIVLSDGNGRSFRATILESSPRNVRAQIKEDIPRRSGAEAPSLALALVKGDRFEWAIEKAVEIGCRRIIPFRSERTVPQYTEAATPKKLDRWRKIVLQAAKQSGLPFKPAIDAPVDFASLCKLFKSFDRAALFYEGERETDIRSFWTSRGKPGGADLVIIGPEGGFAAEEIGLAKRCGVATVSLGSQILRVETAAVAALAIWQYEIGNMAAI